MPPPGSALPGKGPTPSGERAASGGGAARATSDRAGSGGSASRASGDRAGSGSGGRASGGAAGQQRAPRRREPGQQPEAAEARSTSGTLREHGLFLQNVGNLRVRALYSQGGVEIDPTAISRTTSWIMDDKEPLFGTLDMDTKYASAPPALAGGRNSPQKSKDREGKGHYHLIEAESISRSPSEEAPPVETDATGLTQSQVVVYLVTAIIGCGVVVLPSLMAIGGWIVVPVIAALVALAFMEMGRVMDTAIACADGKFKSNEKTKTFEDIGRAAMDTLGVSLIRAVTGTGFFGTLIVYSMLIGQNIHGLLGRRLSMAFVMALVTPLLIVLAVLKDGTLANLMSIGMFASLSSCVLICVKGMQDAKIWQSWPKDAEVHVHRMWPHDPVELGTVLAVMFSAFSVIGTVPCIRGQMRDPKEFLPAFQTALSIVFGVYMAVMFTGYWGYGNYVQHNVVDSMMFPPRTPREALYGNAAEANGHSMVTTNPIGIAMAVLVTTYLFLGFSLFFKCVAGMMRNILGASELFKEGTRQNQVLRAVLVLAVVGVGLLIPHFRDVMAIMSSVCCSCNNVFFPLFFAFKLGIFDDAASKSPFKVTPCRRIGHAFILLLATFCVSLGLWSSLSNLAREMSAVPLHGESASNSTALSRRNATNLPPPLLATTPVPVHAAGIPSATAAMPSTTLAIPSTKVGTPSTPLGIPLVTSTTIPAQLAPFTTSPIPG